VSDRTLTNPFDTGIRMTVIRTPGRTTCSVDEFVLCPTNARADDAERALPALLADHARLTAEVARLTAEVEGLTAERDHYRVTLDAEARRE
jgi:hypothetical protein